MRPLAERDAHMAPREDIPETRDLTLPALFGFFNGGFVIPAAAVLGPYDLLVMHSTR